MRYYTIFRRNLKILLVIGILSSIVTSFMVFFVIKPKFRGSSTILPPYTYRVEAESADYLLTPDEIKNIIQDDSFIDALSKRVGVPSKKIKENLIVRTPTKSKVVLLIFEYTSKEKIVSLLKETLSLLKERDGKFDLYKKSIEEQKNLIAFQKNEIISEIERIKEEIKEINKEESKTEYFMEYSTLLSSLSSLNETLMEINNRISDLSKASSLTQDFSFFNAPSVLDKPVSPKKALDIGLSFILSILIAFIFIVIHESLKED